MENKEKMYFSKTYHSPVGKLTLTGDEEHLVGVGIEGQTHGEVFCGESVIKRSDSPVLRAAEKWLDGYFAGKKPSISALPLAPVGTPFRRAVWEILTEIPYGEVTTYGSIAREVARRLGKTQMSNRAVGGAVGHNPLSIIVPCHRVVGCRGLTGYDGGLDKKIALLRHEGVDLSEGFFPLVPEKIFSQWRSRPGRGGKLKIEN